MQVYDHRNCQSLFGYGRPVHIRSKFVCQLCFCDATNNYDLFRQFSVEHLIGESQGGYLRDVKRTVAKCFPQLSKDERKRIAAIIDEANTVTACHFCNSMTSRNQHEKTLMQLLTEADGIADVRVVQVVSGLAKILAPKAVRGENQEPSSTRSL